MSEGLSYAEKRAGMLKERNADGKWRGGEKMPAASTMDCTGNLTSVATTNKDCSSIGTGNTIQIKM